MRTSSISSSNGVISSKPSKWLSSFTKKSFKLISLSPRPRPRPRTKKTSPPQTPTALSSSPPVSPSSNSSKGSTKVDDDFQEVFRYLDGDGDGKISNLEFRAYFGSIGEYMSYEEAQIVIDDLDKDGDGLLDFREFMELMKREDDDDSGSGDSKKAHEDLKKAFEMYEVEKGSGCITPKSLQRMLHRLGENKSYDQCVAMIRVFDLDDNGMLDFHEFHTMMVS